MKYSAVALQAALLLILPCGAHAGTPTPAGSLAPAATSVVPGAGTLLQDLKPVEPPAPSRSESGLTIEQQGNANLPETAAFPVKTIQISGNISFDTATLHALLADAEGQELTLPELGARVSRITNFFHAHGYPLARAIIPAQTIRDGIVVVQIIEARYGKTVLENHSRVSDALLQATLAPLKSGQVIEQSQLDHTLLQVSDIPGVQPSATLQPGDAPGTSDLMVQTARGPAAAGLVTLDDYGNRYTQRARAGAEVALYDPLRLADILDVSLETSGRDMNYGRISYDVLVNAEGTHVGAAYSALHYVLGDSLASLDGHGTAQVTSLWAKQSLLRTTTYNLSAQLQFDRKELRDEIDVSAIHTDRHLSNGSVSLAGDWRDGLLSGGTNSGSIQWMRGRLDFDNATAERLDAATARTEGNFSQWNATLARLQRLGPKDALDLTVFAQGTNGNLDPSQKLVAGGRYTVRAYDMSAVSGDAGVQSSIEWRHELSADWHGQWGTIAFLDAEHVVVNKQTWAAGKNDATLRGCGIGLSWGTPNRWSAKAYVAARLGAAPILAGDTAFLHAWLEVSKGF